MIAIGQSLNQTFRLSGNIAQEQAAVTLQYIQGLGSGKLAGDEFKSIQEGNHVLLQLLAKELKVNVGALKDLAQESKITGKVMANALLKNFDYLNERAAELSVTTSQAMENLKTDFGFLVEIADEMSGATGGISSFITLISETLYGQADNILTALTTIQHAFQDFTTRIRIGMEDFQLASKKSLIEWVMDMAKILTDIMPDHPLNKLYDAVIGDNIKAVVSDAQVAVDDFDFDNMINEATRYRDTTIDAIDETTIAIGDSFDEMMASDRAQTEAGFLTKVARGLGLDQMARNLSKNARKDLDRLKDTWLGAADVVAVAKEDISNVGVETEEGIYTLGRAYDRLTTSTVGLTAAEEKHSASTKKILDDDKIKKNLIDQQEKYLRNKIKEHREAQSLTGIEGFKGKPLTEAQAFAKAIEAQIAKLKLIDPPMGRYVEHIKKMHHALEGGTLTQKEFADGAVEAGKRFLKLSDEVEETTSAYDLYIERMDIVNPKMSTFVQGIAEMQEALSRGLITVPEFSEQIRLLTEELNNIEAR